MVSLIALFPEPLSSPRTIIKGPGASAGGASGPELGVQVGQSHRVSHLTCMVFGVIWESNQFIKSWIKESPATASFTS